VHVVLTKAFWPSDRVPTERAAIDVHRLLHLIGMADRELPMSPASMPFLIWLILHALAVSYVQKIKHDIQKSSVRIFDFRRGAFRRTYWWRAWICNR
jgi:hypothetical protein